MIRSINSPPPVLIPLWSRDGSVRAYAIVDAADAAWVNQWRWHLDDKGYAKRKDVNNGHVLTVRLHRELLGLIPGDGMEGDHIDLNRLNNSRTNLRTLPKTGRPNNQNTKSRRNTSSRYRGVSWAARQEKWKATVRVSKKDIHLGYFTNELEAAEVSRAARLRLMPYAVD